MDIQGWKNEVLLWIEYLNNMYMCNNYMCINMYKKTFRIYLHSTYKNCCQHKITEPALVCTSDNTKQDLMTACTSKYIHRSILYT